MTSLRGKLAPFVNTNKKEKVVQFFMADIKKTWQGRCISKLSAPAKSLEEEALLSSFIAQPGNHVNHFLSDKHIKMIHIKVHVLYLTADHIFIL